MNHILILDDNDQITASLKREIASFEEYETGQIETASSPREAIDLARHAAERQQAFTIFLLDQNLDAEMDGIQTMQELLMLYPDADTIIFTGYDTPEDGLRAYEAGASRYLPKPFESRELEFVLKELARSQQVKINETRQRHQFEVATKIAEAVGANLDLEITMDAILKTLVEDVFENTRLCVLLYDEEANALRFAPATLEYYQIDNPQFSEQYDFPLEGKTIACRAARKTLQTKTLEIENVPNVEEDDVYLELNPETRSECCASLFSTQHKLLGVLALERGWLNGFDEGDQALIKMAARHISLAIERAKQSEDLEVTSFVSAQTSWAVGIAHDINSEVGKIANRAYLIQKKSKDAEIKDLAQKIEESAYKLAAANPWASHQVQCVEVNPAVKKYVEAICSQKGFEIEVDYLFDADKVQIIINSEQFRFVLKQMINNAIYAMQNIEPKRLYISTRRANHNHVEICFKDFGNGIEMHSREWLFRKPYTTKESGIGGYGLILSYKMIEEMKGKLLLSPYRAGEGAAFIIRLPIDDTSRKGE
jgi:DNA-binding response OmpR family regulator/nitrogen-specific signal transduction histidine kinase